MNLHGLVLPISIHAPHARSDRSELPLRTMHRHFNPRSSCEERRQVLCRAAVPVQYFNPRSPCGERLCFCVTPRRFDLFQSTLPMRGATERILRGPCLCRRFNPRSPCGERPMRPRYHLQPCCFNPRSSCEERHTHKYCSKACSRFQSTLLMRGATTSRYR